MLLTNEEKNQIAEENYSLVFYVVKMFQNSGVSYDELVSIAMVGYAKALNAFDTERNVKFSTYSINCIRNEILFFLRKEKGHMRNNVSLNTVLSIDKNGNNLSLEETVSTQDNDENSLEEDVMVADDVKFLTLALDHLTTKEKYIIINRYGLNGCDIQTQKEIANHIGMSQANVSKMEKSILDKVKRILKEQYNMEDILLD
ncbi:sigma-70 family RNA polymerase sigma factor (plasmid) [Aneurinibacillus sp. Ricciae_BoGa-3]|uniref:sigma-70 family RNA polymerase sigma factor n=1 Tax=Aneurinibacillus sp. Ricciae_BoGa-3 TaxID=3022697 RepID=UPI0023406092|nr:sigma-70 family RNA polymerase sigma factor [Aneurinibacillus sp. Ricciae_BoGa-3]WCK56937.1 sigma-70 family RNA polymerase sigma factor [Aneurinibacillus sp. Ricciae_BoGa-3]WCK57760.1 sigma-70 family RNA polymerase sigma factor [Aneurinibacillus sp. Ricciae_BoGa-3]